MLAEDESRLMEPLQLAGRIIMENGGETYRVEETITRMGHAFGLERVESFAVPSGVFVSFCKSDGANETGVMRVHRGSTNLMRVNAVNTVSREVEAGHLDARQATERLMRIESEQGPYKKPWYVIGAALCSGGFSAMFGGGVLEFFLAFAVGALVQLMSMLLEKHHMQALVSTLLGAIITAFLPELFNAMVAPCVAEAVVAGGLMPLLPGLAMTNAVQDTMRGDMVSGLSHGTSAILTAGLIAGGALMSSALLKMLLGG